MRIHRLVCLGLLVSLQAFGGAQAPNEARRDEWQRPSDVIAALGIGPGSRVADIGAGSGYFTVRLARTVGRQGAVYAVDTNPDVLGRLRTRLEAESLTNVTTIEGAPDDPRLSSGLLDAALIVNGYHEMSRHDALLAAIRGALKPNGRLVILEPISEQRRSLDRAAQEGNHEVASHFVHADLARNGFRLERLEERFASRPAGDTMWMIVASPVPATTAPADTGHDHGAVPARMAAISAALGAKRGAVIADVGAGGGDYAVRLARDVGPEGRVRAVDIDPAALRRLETRAQSAGLTNVETIDGAVDNPRLGTHSIDAALIVNAYHEMTSHQAMLSGIRQALRASGRLVIIEPSAPEGRRESRSQQTARHQISPDLVSKDLRDAGFEIVELQDPFKAPAAHASGTEWMIVAVPRQTRKGPVKPGDPAPEFTGLDDSGRTIYLPQFRGRHVVLEWHERGCPYVSKHYRGGHMQRLQKKWMAQGVAWLLLSSSEEGAHSYLTPEQSRAYLSGLGAAPTAMILDTSGAIGQLYGATTALHIVIVTPDGRVAYAGGIDDRPTTNQADLEGAVNYVDAALNDLFAGRPVRTASSTPYGCSIHYGRRAAPAPALEAYGERNFWRLQYERRTAESLAAQFESDDRPVYRHRTDIVKLLAPRPGMVVAEVGAGSGFLSRMISPLVGPDGRVIANEIEPRMLEYIRTAARRERLDNVETTVGTDRTTGLSPASVDAVLMVSTYSFLEQPAAIIQAMHKALRARGTLVVVDAPSGGRGVRPNPREAIVSQITGGGFELAAEYRGIPAHLALVFTRTSRTPSSPDSILIAPRSRRP
jgi:ubiquinone/menaquinone biosynthesis C-methylase UbiE/peroxiredoxin